MVNRQWCSGSGATGAIAPVPIPQGGAPVPVSLVSRQFCFYLAEIVICKVGVCPGGNRVKKFHRGLFYVGSLSPRGAIFSVWWVFFSILGGEHFCSCPLPPTIFLWEPLVTVFTAQIIITFPDCGGLNLLWEIFNPRKKLALNAHQFFFY